MLVFDDSNFTNGGFAFWQEYIKISTDKREKCHFIYLKFDSKIKKPGHTPGFFIR